MAAALCSVSPYFFIVRRIHSSIVLDSKVGIKQQIITQGELLNFNKSAGMNLLRKSGPFTGIAILNSGSLRNFIARPDKFQEHLE